MRRLALLLLCALPLTTVAEDDPLYPAAQCSAFWLGYADYGLPEPVAGYPSRAAAAFRAVAVRQNDGAAKKIDAFLTRERDAMALLAEAYVYGGDKQSQDLFERLAGTCRDFAATQPETRDLR